MLVLLALPTVGIRLGFGDAGNRPTTDTTRRAYDMISDGFGPGANGPLVLAASTGDGPVDLDTLGTLAGRAADTPGVAAVAAPFPNAAGDAAIVVVTPKTAPQDAATEHLVHRLRDDVVPAVVGDGPTASTWAVPPPPRSTSPSTRPTGCRGSSAACSCCRSCC